jgi:uroporphyrin-III C-methyltransferase/precorrin-2 dehydrogenase/sirohydrochlorin ferrochelatase/uroporphyrin-III C-methyltransferase
MSERPTITNGRKGKVVLMGAGPGDPELITLKAVRHLNLADVILTDRLVNDTIIQSHAPQAVVIPVGKQCRKNKSTPQLTINELMVFHAQAGRYVVRLKGGDVSVFSNIADELETLVQHEIPYEIVPGITAALGAAASLGVPLTSRGLSKGIRLLTFYNDAAIAPGEWENLAATEDTLVFYMSGETSLELAERLISFGKSPDTPIILAEQATTPLEVVTLTTLKDCLTEWKDRTFLSPALLIIGKVAALHNRYSWKQHLTHATEYFPEVIKPAARPTSNMKQVPVQNFL